jgi:hypothetical protein
MINVDYLIYKNKDSLWNNFMIYTSFEFQDKWTKLENWDEQFSNFKTKIFLDELIVEINNISQDLLISLNRWSKKKDIKYLKFKIEKFLFEKNIINNKNDKLIKENQITKNNISIKRSSKINIIESSCLTPPESFFNSFWLKSLKINELDDIYENNDTYNNFTNNNKINNNFDENLIFEIEV